MQIKWMQTRWRLLWLAAGAMILLFAACAAPAPPVAQPEPGGVRTLAQPTATPTEPLAQETEGEVTPIPSFRGGVKMPENTDAIMARLQERAVAEAAKDARVSPEEVLVRVIERVEWNDASLGCPKPGRMYAQVITPGYRILVEAGDQVIEYHTSMNPEGPLVRCDQ